jgi:hypothetical protein
VKPVIIVILVLFGGFIQLVRCIDHATSYQKISYDYDGSYSPELVFNVDASDYDDRPVKKRKTRIRLAHYVVAILPACTREMVYVNDVKLPSVNYFYYSSPLLNEHSLRGPPVASSLRSEFI